MGAMVVFGDTEDIGVRAAVTMAARRVCPGRIRWATGRALAASSWVHAIDRSGAGSVRSGLLDDLVGGTGRARVWFRATTIAPTRRWADSRDEAYAAAEFGALLASWLHLPDAGAVNRVDGASPWGPSWTTARWRQAAAQVGLEVAPLAGATSTRLVTGLRSLPADTGMPYRPPDRTGAGQTVLVVGDQVVGANGQANAAGCRRLASTARCAVLEIAFDVDGRMETAQPLAPVDTPEKVAAVADYLVAEVT